MTYMPESLRLFIFCEGMNWAHLPEAGGLYQQHPQLLEAWLDIFAMKSDHDERNKPKDNKKP